MQVRVIFSNGKEYVTMTDPKYLPRSGDYIAVEHDPEVHQVESVCFNIGQNDIIIVKLKDSDRR